MRVSINSIFLKVNYIDPRC